MSNILGAVKLDIIKIAIKYFQNQDFTQLESSFNSELKDCGLIDFEDRAQLIREQSGKINRTGVRIYRKNKHATWLGISENQMLEMKNQMRLKILESLNL